MRSVFHQLNYKITLAKLCILLIMIYTSTGKQANLRGWSTPQLRSLQSSSNLLIKFPNCTSDTDCSNNGTCNFTHKYCECDKGYVTYVDWTKLKCDSTDANVDIIIQQSELKMCNYKLKDQWTALMISIFIGFGSEHFYLGNNSPGAGKLVFYIFCYYMNIAIFIFYIAFKDKRHYLKFIGTFEAIYLVLGFIGMILWNLRDWIKIGMNDMMDSKGFPMYSWNANENMN